MGKPKDNEDPFDLKPIAKEIPGVDRFKAYVGAYINATAGFKVETTGLFKMRADLDFSFSAMGGLGLSLPKVLLNVSSPSYEYEVPIKALSFGFLGFNLSCGAYAFLDASIDDVSVTLPDELDYMYKVHFYAKKHVVVSSDGVDDVPWEYKFEPREESSVPRHALKDYFLGIKLDFTPRVKIGIRLKVQLGEVADGAIQAGFQYFQPMQFGFNQYKCLFPYLYGKAFSMLDVFLEIPGINVLGYSVLDSLYLPFPIIRKDIPIPYCLFDSLRALEGVENLVFNQTIPSVFIHPKKFQVANQYEYSTKRISNQMILRDKGIEQKFDLIDTAFNPTSYYESGRAFVFTNITSDAVVWYRLIWQDPWLFPEIRKYDYESIKLYEDYHGTVKHFRSVWEDILTFKGTVGVDITTDIFRSFNVEIQKEFDAPGDKEYVSFHAKVPNYTTYGLITHGDNIPYTSGKSSFNTYDDTIKDVSEIQQGEYKGQDPIKFIIKNLVMKQNNVDLTDNLARISVELTRDGVTKNIVTFSDEFSNFVNSDDESHNYIFSSLLSNEDDKINIRVETNEKDGNFEAHYKRNVTFPLALLKEHKTHNFILKEKDQPDWEVTIKVEEYIPTVIMQIDSKGKSGVKGIVCQIYRSEKDTIEFTLDENEQYGILQFVYKTGGQRINDKMSCIIKLHEDLQPLCSNFLQLNDGVYIINLEEGQTLYETHDGYYISIPIRSSNFTNARYKASLKNVFVRPIDGGAMCGSNPTIPMYAGTNIISGCIELPPFNKNFILISDIDGITEEDRDHGSWIIHKYSLPNISRQRFTFSLMTNKFEFSEKLSSIYLAKSNLKKYLSYSNREALEFKCNRCGSIEVEHEDKSIENLTLKANNVWTFDPKVAEDLFFYAICSDESKAYCRVSIDLNKDQVTHIKLPSTNGIIDLVRDIAQGEIVSGLTNFLLTNRTKLEIVKLFNGTIQKLPESVREGILSLIYTKLEGTDFTEISLILGGNPIPMSGSKLYDNIAGVLNILGIDSKSMNSNTLNLSKEGVIKVSNKLISSIFGKKSRKGRSRLLDYDESIEEISQIVDLPKSYIRGIEVIETTRKDESIKSSAARNSKVLVTASVSIAVIAAVAIVIVVGIVIFVKKLRHQADSTGEEMEV